MPSFWPCQDNYRDLLEEIMKADTSDAEPLNPEEKRILARIAMKFPQEQMVYNVAHREQIWKKQARGAIIPYTDSADLTALYPINDFKKGGVTLLPASSPLKWLNIHRLQE